MSSSSSSSSAAAARPIKAVFFDFMGTCLDWCSSVADGLPEGIPNAQRRLIALVWRVAYFRENEQRLALGYGPEEIDETLRRTLDRLLVEDNAAVSAEDWTHIRRAISLPASDTASSFRAYAPYFASAAARGKAISAWHHQRAWPDVQEAIAKLKEEVVGCEVFVHANGTTRLQLDLVRSSGLRMFDLLMSSQLLGHMKPAPEAYRKGLALVQHEPSACVMVAAHVTDVRGAKAVGMRTVYVHRSTDDIHEDLRSVEQEFDVVIDGMATLVEAIQSIR